MRKVSVPIRVRSSSIRSLIARGESAEILKISDTEALKLFYPGHSLVAAVEEQEKTSSVRRVYVKAPWMDPPSRTDGRISLRMELIRGRPLSGRLWISDLRERGLSLGMMHRDLHVRPSEGLPRAGSIYEPAVGELPGLSEELRGRLLDWLRSRRDDRLCHGDFHPGNVLQTTGEWRLIRWREAFAGDPLADIALTLAALRRTPGLSNWYLKGYFAREAPPRDDLARWALLNRILVRSRRKGGSPVLRRVSALRLSAAVRRLFA
jgi:thiamine kinase